MKHMEKSSEYETDAYNSVEIQPSK